MKFRGRENLIDDFTIMSNEITHIIGNILKGRKWRVHWYKIFDLGSMDAVLEVKRSHREWRA